VSEEEAAAVRSELIALQAILIGLLKRLVADQPAMVPTLCRAFEEAESTLTGVAVKMGLQAPIESTVGALKVVEEIRSAVIRDEDLCTRASD
jgi:hypothetical protein